MTKRASTIQVEANLSLVHWQSVVPEDWHPAKRIASDRHAANREKRQVGCHKQLATRRQLPQEIDPDTSRFFGVVLETVVPIRLIETHCKHGVTGKRVYGDASGAR